MTAFNCLTAVSNADVDLGMLKAVLTETVEHFSTPDDYPYISRIAPHIEVLLNTCLILLERVNDDLRPILEADDSYEGRHDA